GVALGVAPTKSAKVGQQSAFGTIGECCNGVALTAIPYASAPPENYALGPIKHKTPLSFRPAGFLSCNSTSTARGGLDLASIVSPSLALRPRDRVNGVV